MLSDLRSPAKLDLTISRDSVPRLCEVCASDTFAPRFIKAGHQYERCGGCGLERIDPPPSDAELQRIYGAHYYDSWGIASGAEAVAAIKKATCGRAIAAAQPLPSGARVLDCGAATGYLMERAAELGYDPYAVELSAHGAAAIAERFGSGHVFQGELQDARFPLSEDRPFAAVFMCDYLEHVRDPMSVLRCAVNLLSARGTLVISTPRVGSLTQRAMRASWTHYKTEHLYYFTAASLRRLLEMAGFSDTRVGPAWKVMTIGYLRHQFQTYEHPLFTPLARLAARLPERVQTYRFPLLMGEMLAVARRDAGAGS